jgi:hypothetical protein
MPKGATKLAFSFDIAQRAALIFFAAATISTNFPA